MLQRYKKLAWSILPLLLMAWTLQSTVPIITASLIHHSEMGMHCDLGSSCSSCQLKGKTECNCKHGHAGEVESTTLKLCGCSHHDGMNEGIVSVSALKAIFYKTPILLKRTPDTLDRLTSETAFSFFAKDIFHPPRLTA